MPSRQRLSPSQRKNVEWLARRKGITCETCGSANLTCLDTVLRYVGNNLEVELRCTNHGRHVGGGGAVQRFQFPSDVALVMGIEVR
jgi:hypothetical protein